MTWAGLRAGQHLCWSGASARSCGAPASARLLPAQVWPADARRLNTRTHESKATNASEDAKLNASEDRRGAQPPHTAGGNTTRGETAHGETHLPTINDRDAQTKKKTTNVANLQRGRKIKKNNIDTDTERSIKQNEKESENRQREQPLRRQGASGRHVWDTVRHYINMIQAEPNDALQALTAQIPDRGWRLAAKKIKGSRWRDRKK